MTTHTIAIANEELSGVTANDRLKQRFDGIFAVSLVLATTMHVLVFELFPTLQADGWASLGGEVIDVVHIEPNIDLPENPPEMARPAAPVISIDAGPEHTLSTFTFEEYIALPPAPAAETATASGTSVPFTPYTSAPQLENPRRLQLALERAYPAVPRDAGLGGTVNLLIHIDREGTVLEARVRDSSSYAALDEAAMRLVEMMRFRPAMNRDRYVAVWISIPLTFTVR